MRSHQNRVLTLLSLAQMWKFFSHFGVRVLLVLYLVQYLDLSDGRAFGINALFCGLAELGAIFGGILADRYLGLRRALLTGAVLLTLGYLGLLFESQLVLAMGLIITGGSLFSSNITALLGQAYEGEDSQREKGFTIFYMMQNLGALISTLVCGVVAAHFGFRLGFALAASGMVFGMATLFLGRRVLDGLSPVPKEGKQSLLPGIYLLGILFAAVGLMMLEKWILRLLPGITLLLLCGVGVYIRRGGEGGVAKLFIYLGGLILFFAVEDQICSSLILFAERETGRTIFGWVIPSSFITSLNPIVILLGGAYIARKKVQMLTPFLLTAMAFGVLTCLTLLSLKISIFGVMGVVVVISIAELMIGPLVMSVASEVASKGNPGTVMGMIPIAFSLAYQVSGGLSKMVALEDQMFSYRMGFGLTALLMLIGGIVLQLLMNRYAHEKNPIS